MDETEHLSGLIGEIYDAALDPSLWQGVLKQTCEYVEGCASSLLSQDSAHQSGQFYFSWGDDPLYTKLYFEKYLKINPLLAPTVAAARIGEVTTVLDLIPHDEYFASRFYKEWAQPQGYLDSVHGVLDKSNTTYAAIAVVRHEDRGRIDDEARRRLSLLLPHFRRAVAVGKVIDLHKVEAAAMADALDGLASAMFLVDADGRIVYANAAGSTLVEKRSLIRAAAGKFSAVDAQADRALRDVFANAEDGDTVLGVKGVAVPLTSREGERYVAHVLPLTSGARRKAGVAYSAVAAVFVHKAALELPHPIETIANTFKLTPGEMRVLMMIIKLGGVPEVAPALGISEATVKTHLQRIFAKTGTSRQADLVKLVAGYMSPLGG
jgi:DNA-binding CsgD family transcriptional regulator/PAS domain-containing protein